MSKKADVVAEAVFERGLAQILPDGSELLDSRPLEIPVGFERPESLQESIRRMLTDPQLRRELEDAGMESFEEADDLDIPDDVPQSPHEDQFDPLHLLARDQEVRSGMVKPRSPEEVAAANEVILRVRKELESKNKPADAGKGA